MHSKVCTPWAHIERCIIMQLFVGGIRNRTESFRDGFQFSVNLSSCKLFPFSLLQVLSCILFKDFTDYFPI